MAQRFDRSQEDAGNSVQLEHLNLRQPDQRLATIDHRRGHRLFQHAECATHLFEQGKNGDEFCTRFGIAEEVVQPLLDAL